MKKQKKQKIVYELLNKNEYNPNTICVGGFWKCFLYHSIILITTSFLSIFNKKYDDPDYDYYLKEH